MFKGVLVPHTQSEHCQIMAQSQLIMFIKALSQSEKTKGQGQKVGLHTVHNVGRLDKCRSAVTSIGGFKIH